MLRHSYTALNESKNFPSGFPFCMCFGWFFGVIFLSLVHLECGWKVVLAHRPVPKGIKSIIVSFRAPCNKASLIALCNISASRDKKSVLKHRAWCENLSAAVQWCFSQSQLHALTGSFPCAPQAGAAALSPPTGRRWRWGWMTAASWWSMLTLWRTWSPSTTGRRWSRISSFPEVQPGDEVGEQCESCRLFLLSRQGWMFQRNTDCVCAPCIKYFTIAWIDCSAESHTGNTQVYPLITSVSPPHRIRQVPGCGFPR